MVMGSRGGGGAEDGAQGVGRTRGGGGHGVNVGSLDPELGTLPPPAACRTGSDHSRLKEGGKDSRVQP